MKRSKGQGKIAQRVTNLLLDELGKLYPGIGIAPEDFWFQKGDYTHKTWDCALWGAFIPIPRTGIKISLHSWDSMALCARGLSLSRDHRDLPHEFCVVATNDPK